MKGLKVSFEIKKREKIPMLVILENLLAFVTAFILFLWFVFISYYLK